MPLTPPVPPSVYVEQAPAQRVPGPGQPDVERHYEEPPDLSILEYMQMSQLAPAITGAIVPGNMGAEFKACDPELIAIGNRALKRWFKRYQRERGGYSN